MKMQISKNRFLLGLMFCLISFSAYAADQVIYEENFNGSSGWSTDYGVWEVGYPASGPVGSPDESKCAATALSGTYPGHTDSRLILPYFSPWDQGLELPEVSDDEEIHLRFWHWFSYSTYDYGQVQVSVLDESSGTWGDWENNGISLPSASGGWTLKDIDLTYYAGNTVRIAFYHYADRNQYNQASESYGWYIDDVSFELITPTFTGDFESGQGHWSADRGVWQIGTPTSGPGACYDGVNCAGTVLEGNYPGHADSRLISAAVKLNPVFGDQELHLRFWNWFSYSTYDYGQVQVSLLDEGNGIWTDWEGIGTSVSSTSGGWNLKDVDLTDYAGKTIRIAFFHYVDRNQYNQASESTGWYIDNITIQLWTPSFTGDFESGQEQWSADRGVWQIGTPTGGPGECHEGDFCAGTVLNGNYPGHTDSRLISATVKLPESDGKTEPYLQFWNWFSYSSYDSGQVQVSVYDSTNSTWGAWESVGRSVASTAGGWSVKDVWLSAYAGKTVRFAFLHTAGRNQYNQASESSGWYIDQIKIINKVQEFSGDFEMGWMDWSADRGVWQVGLPTTGPGRCFNGTSCAGTVLNGNYPGYTDSRLISATIDLTQTSLPIVYLSFMEWVSYSSYDSGTVQVTYWNPDTATWSGWETVATQGGSEMIDGWIKKYSDLSAYAGKLFSICFLHQADRNQYGQASESHGWFVDNIELVGPTTVMPEIKSFSFSRYIPEPCTSKIDIFAYDPLNQDVGYSWLMTKGAVLTGESGSFEFTPPEIRLEPYTVMVAANSKLTQINSYAKKMKIYTEVLYDLDTDDDIDGADLYHFLQQVEITQTSLTRLAEEFGLVACTP
ncbi:MAG: hypothetical protein GY699_10905 [Desulfobacteraceae bacterium]|nr:hypothetical protein [Desulfobacteraceae bacterium]